MLPIFLILGALTTHVVQADDDIPDKVLRKLVKATVYIEVRRGTTVLDSGTGFVAHRHGRSRYILTNQRLIEPARNDEFQIDVVFFSGTRREKTLPGKVLLPDRELDVALVQVEASGLPDAIDVSGRPLISSSDAVRVFSFPRIGQRDGSHPSVEMHKAHVGEIEQFRGAIQYIDLAGGLRAADCGGPVVGSSGLLVGMGAVPGEASGPARVIPVGVLEDLLLGRVREITFYEQTIKEGAVQLRAEAQLADPMGMIKDVDVVLAPQIEKRQSPDGQPLEAEPQILQGREYALNISADRAFGEISLNTASRRSLVLLMQVKVQRKNGSTQYTNPRELIVVHAEPPTASDPSLPSQDGAYTVSNNAFKTPAPILDVHVAQRGKSLVLRLQGVPGLAIYDSDAGDIVRTIRLPDEQFVFGAGGELVLVYLPKNNILQSWNIETLSKREVPNPFADPIDQLVLGHSRSDLAVARVRSATDHSVQAIDTLALRPVLDGGQPLLKVRSASAVNDLQFRTDGALEFLAAWKTNEHPSGLLTFRYDRPRYQTAYNDISAGALMVGDDHLIYTTSGKIYKPSLRQLGKLDSEVPYPGIGSTLYVGMNNDGLVKIYNSPSTRPIGTWGEFPMWKPSGVGRDNWKYNSPVALDRRIVFVPLQDRIMFIPPDDHHIVLRQFKLSDVVDTSDVAESPLVVSTPRASVIGGQTWRYKIKVLAPADVQFTLDFGPPGMELVGDGELIWRVPDRDVVEEKVIVAVTNGEGQKVYHTFTLVGGAPASGAQSSLADFAGKAHHFDYTGR